MGIDKFTDLQMVCWSAGGSKVGIYIRGKGSNMGLLDKEEHGNFRLCNARIEMCFLGSAGGGLACCCSVEVRG